MDFGGFNRPAFGMRQPVSMPVTGKKPRGGTASSLISEGGGLGGALGGAALGTAILPGIGTLLGAGIGGFLGGTGGRVAENKIRDDRIGIGDALKEGAVSGVFGAGPVRLLKGAGAAAKGLSAGAGLSEALVSAGTKATGSSLLGKAGSKVAEGSDTLVTKAFRLTPSQLTNFKKKFGEDASSVIRKYGFKNADDVIAKGVQPLNDEFGRIVNAIPSVSKAEVEKSLRSAYEPLLKKGIPTDKQAIGKQLKAEADNILSGFGDAIPGTELNVLKQSFDELVNYTEKAANPARYGVNKRAADALRKTLQGVGDKLGLKTESGMSLKEVGLELRKLKQLEDITGKQSNLGRGSLPLGLGNLMGGAAGGAGGGLPGIVGGGLAVSVANSNPGRRALAAGAGKLSGGLTSAGSKLAGDNLISAGGRQLAGAATRNAATMGQPQSLEDALMQSGEGDYLSSMSMDNTTTMPTATNAPMNANIMGGLSQGGGDLSSQYAADPTNPKFLGVDPAQFGYPADTTATPYSKANLLADLKRDPKNSKEYLNYYAMINEIFNPPEPKQKALNATQQQQSNNAISALQDLQLIRNEIQRDPSVSAKASLPGGSLTQRLTGSGQFESARKNVGDVLARLRSGAAITNDEYKRYVALLPSAFDSPDLADKKLTRLEELLSSFAYEMNGGGGLPGTLDEALMQYST